MLEVTGLSHLLTRMPRSAVGYLERAGEEDVRTTLDELARGARLGLRRGDEATSKQAVARIAAARTAKWLTRVVLPLQDVLIDAPHLVSRNAALLVGGDFDAAACVPCDHGSVPLVPELSDDAH